MLIDLPVPPPFKSRPVDGSNCTILIHRASRQHVLDPLEKPCDECEVCGTITDSIDKKTQYYLFKFTGDLSKLCELSDRLGYPLYLSTPGHEWGDKNYRSIIIVDSYL